MSIVTTRENWELPRTMTPEHCEKQQLYKSLSDGNYPSIQPKRRGIPMRKSSRFGSLFSLNDSRYLLKTAALEEQQTESRVHKREGSNGSEKSVCSESTSHSNSFSRSISNLLSSPASWTKKHLHHHSEPASPTAAVPRLNERYGHYIKPTQKGTKASGSTNKNNIGSGATAVIRLVQSSGRILAVKEFIKRGKSEDEKEYLKRMHNEYCISKTVSGHPNVVETIDLVMDEKDRWCTVMEYVS